MSNIISIQKFPLKSYSIEVVKILLQKPPLKPMLTKGVKPDDWWFVDLQIAISNPAEWNHIFYWLISKGKYHQANTSVSTQSGNSNSWHQITTTKLIWLIISVPLELIRSIGAMIPSCETFSHWVWDPTTPFVSLPRLWPSPPPPPPLHTYCWCAQCQKAFMDWCVEIYRAPYLRWQAPFWGQRVLRLWNVIMWRLVKCGCGCDDLWAT